MRNCWSFLVRIASSVQINMFRNEKRDQYQAKRAKKLANKTVDYSVGF